MDRKEREMEYNVDTVRAASSRSGYVQPEPLWYELLEREVGSRRWTKVGTTKDRQEAVEWAGRSGYKVR